MNNVSKIIAVCALAASASGLFGTANAQSGAVSAICSTDQSWCELAAAEFTRSTGIRVLQTRKATGEALAQLRAEANNPKTDLWWGGTGDPFLQGAELGLLDAYRPDYINDLQSWSVRQYAMTQNMVGGFYTSAIGFGWNTELLKKKKLPVLNTMKTISLRLWRLHRLSWRQAKSVWYCWIQFVNILQVNNAKSLQRVMNQQQRWQRTMLKGSLNLSNSMKSLSA